ncbi:hypothetical protein PUNSTDRAFT_137923 [Punctularia strigosozonata HHB-11173 SS5]|uniref:CHAT domain-containing protein n=1 Tax=Punctularia strigosozonata (strain HHB-11173) TaxID=741275 RepID=R7S4F0_PUNST|nr:uncharacterized protein PUNSTDRAFT_137923 [Punctularia strigosozonata HHB-11173 SS5]EIN05240.1 hypothetical protein PUNSTDRAFT_137923 [Punctularia strigosozonata HHB-11173 SS5]
MLWTLYLKTLRSGSINELNKAIELGLNTLKEVSGAGLGRVDTLRVVAALLDFRHQLAPSDGRDLEKSVTLNREALQQFPPNHTVYWMYVNSLALKLYLQYNWTGEISCLEESIQLGRSSIDSMPTTHAHRSVPARDLAHSLMLRFNETRRISDLDEAIKWDRRALASSATSHVFYPEISAQAVSRLCMLFDARGSFEALEEAITLGNTVLDTMASDHAERGDVILELSKALLRRGRHQGNIADIDRSISELARIKEVMLQRTEGPKLLSTLADCHIVRFRFNRSDKDANDALEIITGLLDTLHPGRPERFQCLVDAAELHMELGTSYRSIQAALSQLADALSDEHRDVRSRIEGARRILDIAVSQYQDIVSAEAAAHRQLLDIFALVVGLLPRVAFFDLHLHTRLQSLAIGQSIALTGASHALIIGSSQKALEILEQGRAVFWTHALRLRSPFEAAPKELRDRLSILARQLGKVHDKSSTGENLGAVEAEIARRRGQIEEFNVLLNQVRKLPGLDRFLLHDEFTTLRKASERGPVVVLVSSALGCHAILLKQRGDCVSIPIEHLPDTWLAHSGTEWRSIIVEARAEMRDCRKMEKSKITKTRRAGAEEILRQLWIEVVRPVIKALGLEPSEGRNRPRIWWCPTGNFAHLPIHAAGAGGERCSDYVVSSYIPTLGSLLAARNAYSPILKDDMQALVAATPRSSISQWSDLINTREEARAIRAVLPSGAIIELPPADDACIEGGNGITAETLLKLLPQTNILHLACHGHQDLENPLQSGFILRDEELTIERLMHVPLPRAFMAFLSACETAKGDFNQPDQVVHLAAAMFFAGFKSVIATLWSMADADGPEIARSVYQKIFSSKLNHIDPDDIAYALDEAVTKLRTVQPEPLRWAPYIHLGI